MREEGELPEGWVRTTLGQVTRPSSAKIEPQQAKSAKYLSLEHIESNGHRILGVGFGSDVTSTKSVFQAGDVLYGKLRPYLNKVCRPDFGGICSTDILVFPESDQVDGAFLMRLLSLGEFVDFANERSAGVQLPRTSFEKLAGFQFALPPLTEQRRIAARVDRLLANVNLARERVVRVRGILKRLRQAVLAAACSGRLTAVWRTVNPPNVFVPGLGRMLEPSNPEADPLPATWSWASFGTVTENFDGRRVPIKSSDREQRHGLYVYYGASGPVDTIDDFLFDGDFLLIGEDGANLLARSTPIAFRATGRFWVNNHAHVVRPLSGIPLKYLEFFVNGLDLQAYVTGTAQPKLTQAALNRIPVPLGPLSEMHEVVRRVEALFKLADAIETRISAAASRAEGLTQTILAKAFRGELVPTDAEVGRREAGTPGQAAALAGRGTGSGGVH